MELPDLWRCAVIRNLYCSFCHKEHALSEAWRELWYTPDGVLHIQPIDPVRHNAVSEFYVCGRRGVAIFVDRYLYQGNFDAPPPIDTTGTDIPDQLHD
jgi:hypothetical protein